MAAAAHDPKFAKKAGIPSSVAEDFYNADKGQKIAKALESRDLKHRTTRL